jgi:hypothetical protein
MKQGEIVGEGSHHQLLDENEYYAELVAKQLQGRKIMTAKSVSLGRISSREEED